MESEPAERWLPIIGFEGYEVSSLGRVRSWVQGHGSPNTGDGKEPRVMKQHVRDKDGSYLAVQMTSGPKGSRKPRNVAVAPAVLLAFVGPKPERTYVTWLNGDRHDNRLENLSWGVFRPVKISDEVVSEIIDALLTGEATGTIADRFAVSRDLVIQVARGSNRAGVRPEVLRPIERLGLRKLTQEAVAAVIDGLLAGKSEAELARCHTVSHSLINLIRTGKAHCSVCPDVQRPITPGQAKLSQSVVKKILKDLVAGRKASAVAKKYGLKRNHVWQIGRGILHAKVCPEIQRPILASSSRA
jgi:hypothetical protein